MVTLGSFIEIVLLSVVEIAKPASNFSVSEESGMFVEMILSLYVERDSTGDLALVGSERAGMK